MQPGDLVASLDRFLLVPSAVRGQLAHEETDDDEQHLGGDVGRPADPERSVRPGEQEVEGGRGDQRLGERRRAGAGPGTATATVTTTSDQRGRPRRRGGLGSARAGRRRRWAPPRRRTRNARGPALGAARTNEAARSPAGDGRSISHGHSSLRRRHHEVRRAGLMMDSLLLVLGAPFPRLRNIWVPLWRPAIERRPRKTRVMASPLPSTNTHSSRRDPRQRLNPDGLDAAGDLHPRTPLQRGDRLRARLDRWERVLPSMTVAGAADGTPVRTGDRSRRSSRPTAHSRWRPGATWKGMMVAFTCGSWPTMSTMRSAVWSCRTRRHRLPYERRGRRRLTSVSPSASSAASSRAARPRRRSGQSMTSSGRQESPGSAANGRDEQGSGAALGGRC